MALRPAKQSEAYKAMCKDSKNKEKEVKKTAKSEEKKKKKQSDLWAIPGDTSDLG